MSAHISSFVILCRPDARAQVAAAVAALPGVEIHHVAGNGKIVALAEGGEEQHIGDALAKMQTLPGVVAANMVYYGVAEGDEHG